MTDPIKVSVIVPIAPWEDNASQLQQELSKLTHGFEVILVHHQGAPTLTSYRQIDLSIPITHLEVAIHQAKVKGDQIVNGRAHLMNQGFTKAQGAFVWFLHLDSCLTNNSLERLMSSLETQPNALLYFDLLFLSDASWLMQLNRWGVYWRSRYLHLPFGDQGFCLHRYTFDKLGGYPETCLYGEDHLLVWRALQQGIKVISVRGQLATSARKYKQQGWLHTTGKHLFLWLKQAWPEYKKLRQSKANQQSTNLL